MIATQWDDNKEIMNNTFEALRGLTRDCFEDCEEKGVLYGVGLENAKEVLDHKDYLEQAYNMGENS